VSGFVGILHLDGSPMDRSVVERLTEFQKFRGPDAQKSWVNGCVGLGHTLLRTCRESERESQPFSLNGETWIVADCRVDARAALIANLEEHGHHNIAEIPDAELILRAYTVWGDNCADHLLGDYAFAIWDGPHRRLFCARDQFGVKPFYYAHIGFRLIFSNTLDCVRQHPAVSGDLNDLAIADFLLFDMIQEPGATSFKDVHRLPPAHTLTVAGENILIRRYWTLPLSGPIHHVRDNDCVEKFRELMDTAVADRLRTNNAGVLMSGGLDSSTVAASAQRSLVRNGIDSGLRAYTEIFESLIPHEESRYARLVAEELKIPIQFQVNDGSGVWEQANHRNHRWPEPIHLPWSDAAIGILRQVAVTRRVGLTGFGGDPTLTSLLTVHFRELCRNRQFGRAVADAARYLAAEGRFSRLYIRNRFDRWFPSKGSLPHFPSWLNPEMEKRLGLRERWRTLKVPPAPKGAVRPVAYEAITDPMWWTLFDIYDPGVTRVPVEVRHPFFDLRLVNFLLALPALPWCSDKQLLRKAAKGVLPDAVGLRRKSPLLAEPLIALLDRQESSWVDSFRAVPELDRYVERRLIPKVFKEREPWSAWIHLRPLSLNFWLLSKDSAV
jgi:asparagine synthase (glutamine-hydrolysing)